MRLKYLFVVMAIMQIAPWILLLLTDMYGDSKLFYLLELFALLNCGLLWLFYSKLLRPVDTMAGGIDMLRAQDWNNSLKPVGQPEVDKISGLFNEMLERLKEQRIRYEERNHLLNLLIEAAPIGVVILDFNGDEVVKNRAADKLDLSLEKLRTLPVGESRDYRVGSGVVIRCSCHSFIDRGVEHRFYIADDISGSVNAAERSAYEKVIRVMAHEVNNTMAGFSSVISTAVTEIEDEDIKEVLQACLTRSEELSRFTARFAEVVKLPAPRVAPVALGDIIMSEQRFLESLAKLKGIEMKFPERIMGNSMVLADSGLLAQVLVNIVKNSVESILLREEGATGGRIKLEVSETTLTVTDNGIGISPEKAAHLFTPFFTDKPRGQGIGLMLIREVLTAHNARFSLTTSPDDHLTRFTITFLPGE